jgi:hypothetical protein
MRARFFFILLLLFPCFSHGATYYAATSGGNSCGNATNQNSPIQSLGAGLNCLSGGDTLIVQSGVYQEGIFEQGSGYPSIPDGSPGSPTTVRSAVQYGAVLQPSHPQTVGGNIIYMKNQHDVVIDGLTIDMSRLNCGNGSGFALLGVNGNIVLQNSDIKNMCGPGNPNGANGVGVGHRIRAGASFTARISNNLIHDLAYGFNETSEVVAMGYYVVGDHIIIENNTLWNIGGYCGESWSSGNFEEVVGGSVTNDNNTYRNNICYHSGGIGLLFSGGSNSVMYNNVIYNVNTNPNISNVGLYFGDAGINSYDYAAYNNTIYGAVGKCLVVGQKHTRAVVRNNICYGNGSDAIENSGSGSTIDTNWCSGAGCSRSGNPSFVNPGGADFHLNSGSQAMDAGVNLSSIFTTDLSGNPRPTGAGWDMGAYEVGGPPPPTRLRFTTQPQSTPVNQIIPAVVVQAQDGSGNLTSSFSGNVTMALVTSSGVVPFGQTSLVSVDTANASYPGVQARDGNTQTFWHTPYTPNDPSDTPPPHTLIVNLGASYPVNGIRYLPRQDGNQNATIAQYDIAVSTDGNAWGTSVATGTFSTTDTSEKTVTFSPKTGQYVRLIAVSNVFGNPWTAVAELTTLYQAAGTCPGTLSSTSGLTRPASGGQATFPNMKIDAAGTCQLHATAATLTPDDSATFAITGSATHLGFVAQPSTVVIGQTLPPVTVQFLDAANNPYSTTQAVNIALATCPGATLGGTASRAANTSGLATFNDLNVNVVCPSATLVASASGMTGATSSAFAVLSTIPNPFLTGEWVARGVSSHACAATAGDTNFASSSGTDHDHTLTCPVPAGVFKAGALLESCALVDVVTDGTGTQPAFKLKVGGLVLATNATGTVPPNTANNGWVCFNTLITQNPGGAVPTYSSFFASAPAFASHVNSTGQTAQPVNEATSGPLTLGFTSRWDSVGSGQNALTLHSMIFGLANE